MTRHLLAASVLVACSSRDSDRHARDDWPPAPAAPTLNGGQLESSIAVSARAKNCKVKSVACPTRRAHEGDDFTCKIMLEDGTEGTARVYQKDGRGSLDTSANLPCKPLHVGEWVTLEDGERAVVHSAESGRIDVEVCAGDEQLSINALDWTIQFVDNTMSEPVFTRETTVRPGHIEAHQCQRGAVAMTNPRAQTVKSVVYQGTSKEKARWIP